MNFVEHCVTNYIKNLDKIFTINFTLLAFIITALTILLIVNKGVIIEFKKAGLMDKINNKFKRALNFNFFSGTFAFIVYFLQIDNFIYQGFVTFISLILFFTSLYYTYKTYDWIIFFINHE